MTTRALGQKAKRESEHLHGPSLYQRRVSPRTSIFIMPQSFSVDITACLHPLYLLLVVRSGIRYHHLRRRCRRLCRNLELLGRSSKDGISDRIVEMRGAILRVGWEGRG